MVDEMGDYQPIDCGFHDRLLEWATFRRRTRITYQDHRGAHVEVVDVINDVFTRSGAEYLRLRGGIEIRLDRILQVDDTPEPGT